MLEYGNKPMNGEKKFIQQIDNCFLGNITAYIVFANGNVEQYIRLNKSVFLWQDAKGQISYSFCLLDKEEFTTTAIKLSNALSSHFDGYEIEVVNNNNEWSKKQAAAITGLSKSVENFQRYETFSAYSQEKQQGYNINDLQLP